MQTLGIELVDGDRLRSWLVTRMTKAVLEPSPIKRFQTVFISHSYKDFDLASRLNAALRERGVRTWFGHENITAGSKVHDSSFAAAASPCPITGIAENATKKSAIDSFRSRVALIWRPTVASNDKCNCSVTEYFSLTTFLTKLVLNSLCVRSALSRRN